jgi:hypothetical protein
MVILVLLSFMLGIRMNITAVVHPIDYVIVWVIVIMTIYLCIRDAQRHGRTILHIYRMIMFFTWPWSILFYYIRFHGWKGMILLLLWGLLLAAFYCGGGILAVIFIECGPLAHRGV